MYSKDDTICAISTPSGKGAIAVIRCSGSRAFEICEKIVQLNSGNNVISDLPANTMHYSIVYDGNEIIDQVVTGIFRKPHSYSGEDTVEISCHGSPYIQKKILELLVQSGARMATPGEFTMRAFFNGKLDLTQVEAVADLISSGSEAAHRIAINQMRGGFTREIKKLRNKLLNFTTLVELELDFSEEDVEFADRNALKSLIDEITGTLESLSDSFKQGNAIKQGIPVAIVGRTNAGKSTLLNLLLREEKAIVSEIEGTTRDSIEDVISIKGIHFRLIDTAGLRHTEDVVEQMGIERTWQKIDQAMIIIQVLDIKSKDEEVKNVADRIRNSQNGDIKKRILVLNKIDKISKEKQEEIIEEHKTRLNQGEMIIPVSASHGTNLQLLEQALLDAAGYAESEENDVIITNVRHYEALEKALSAMKRAKEGLINSVPGDLLAQDIRETMHYLGEITGEITTDEVLGNIFKNFCIGK
ncbi:MAG TPA: tRNA uridine-5-carboxymethylaminomethyl(34) synthesis GTPase MnmE [Bacteroidales bacterium]|jgi:tRNA modification GTPase|nr:tRNA uridine-5-carboxymethylaminomethyl(34) synthesis GTPase MnmE [Bacteroidales bacterium]